MRKSGINGVLSTNVTLDQSPYKLYRLEIRVVWWGKEHLMPLRFSQLHHPHFFIGYSGEARPKIWTTSPTPAITATRMRIEAILAIFDRICSRPEPSVVAVEINIEQIKLRMRVRVCPFSTDLKSEGLYLAIVESIWRIFIACCLSFWIQNDPSRKPS